MSTMQASANVLDNAIAAFGGVTAIAPAKPKKKSSGKERERKELGEDMDFLAALSLVADTLQSQADLIAAELKQRCLGTMAETMLATRKKPEAFLGCGPQSEGYVGYARKGSNRPLDEQVQARLTELGISMTWQESVPARLILNPEVLANPVHMRAIVDAIKNAPELAGVPVVLQQPAQFYYSTAETTVDELAKADLSLEEAKDLLGKVGGVTVGKFQIEGVDNPRDLLSRSLQIIQQSRLITGMTAAIPAQAGS